MVLDDNEGRTTNLMAFVHALNAVGPYQDALFYCNMFKKLATDYVPELKKNKSKILTLRNDRSVIQYLHYELKN